MKRLENIFGALALTMVDRLNKIAVESSDCSEGGAIALARIGTLTATTIDDLRASLNVDTHSAATRVVSRLEAEQLVLKAKGDGDGRYVHLALTKKGQEARNSLLSDRERFLENTLSILSDKERDALEKILNKLFLNVPFDLKMCDRTCRFCDTSVCLNSECPVQIRHGSRGTL